MGAKVLIVDDSKLLQNLLKNVVQGAGFTVIGCAGDGDLGLELFLKHKPDLTLMDVTMPNMSGKECLEKILQAQPTAKVIMISGLCDPHVESECLALGAKRFISKSDITDMNSFQEKIIESIISLNKDDYAA